MELFAFCSRCSVEEMHVAPENDCEKSRDESEPSADKLVSDSKDATPEELFPPVNGVVKSAVSIEIDEKLAPLTEEDSGKESGADVAADEADENVEEPLANGVDHDASDDLEEEDVAEDEPMVSTADEPVAEETPTAADEKRVPDAGECRTRMVTDEPEAAVPPESEPPVPAEVEDERPAATTPAPPVTSEPAATESAEERSPAEITADQSEPSPVDAAAPTVSPATPIPEASAEVGPEDVEMAEAVDEKAEESVEPLEEASVKAPVEAPESPEKPGCEEKANCLKENETLELASEPSPADAEKLLCKEEVTTPVPEDPVTNSNCEVGGFESKVIDKIAHSISKSEPVDKKPQVFLLRN